MYFQNVPVKLRQINMYGTLYNYKGYGLDANNYEKLYICIYIYI